MTEENRNINIVSNIVPEETVREIQSKTLEIISKALSKSFGPDGSTTAIVKNLDPKGNNISIEYTKDGHTIIENISFLNPIERSVQNLLTDLTRYIVKEVGDGTTSAILLCNTIFKYLCEINSINITAKEVIDGMNKVMDEVKDRIINKAWECSIDDIYNISLIATNNNEEISKTIKNVYEKYGLDVFIDVGISNERENIIKEYDGMTIDTGFADISMVNDREHNMASVRNPKIYCFNDPIDTPEMLALLDVILDNNIFRWFQTGNPDKCIPTVIMSKIISPDTSSYFESMIKLMNQRPGSVPLLIISDIHQPYIYEDIAKMCGAPFIKKYLNPELQKKDVEAGLAPTTETILDFCGTADLVQSDQYKSKIIRPSKMFNENGDYSDEYLMMVNYLENQVEIAKRENAGVNRIQTAKRRLNSFRGNMVDFLIGGVTLADRNNLKAAVEDAVFNCRSASINGVGYGANYMAFSSLYEIIKDNIYKDDEATSKFASILYKAYKEVICILYNITNDEEYIEFEQSMINNKCPLNIRSNYYDHKVTSSIKSDIAILETISNILLLMYTSNQYLVQTPMHNIYES